MSFIAYRYRIYPNKKQRIHIKKTFGCCRLIYNIMLGDKIKHYEEKGEMLKNTPAMYKEEYEFLKEVDSLALANEQLFLEKAFKSFFKSKGVGFPKFKSKKKDKNSYTTNNQKGSIRIEDKKIKLPKVGYVKIKEHRKINEKHSIKSVTVTLEPDGKYYVSIICEYDNQVQTMLNVCNAEPKTGTIVIDEEKILGLDFSMPKLYVASDGSTAEYPRYYRKAEEKLKKEQRKLAKMELGSKNREKQRIKVARLHRKIVNQRKDFLHKLSRKIVTSYDVIVIEDLNMKTMSQALNFGKSVSDDAYGKFTTYLKYKLENENKKLVKVDKFYASSRLCSNCGYKNDETKDLNVREWTCTKCGTHHDRDINAAINIKNEGIRMLTA